MASIFGIPIIVAIILGILFPYVAFELVPLGIIFLFLLMFFAGITVEWGKFNLKTAASPAVITGLVFLFIVFPACQWLIASILVKDEQYLYGLVLASLCPAAIVAPFFVKAVESDTELSFVLVIASMLLFPIVAPFILQILVGGSDEFNSIPIAKYMVLLVTLPVLAGYLVYRLAGGIVRRIAPHMGLANMLCLSALIFILFGTAARRINLHYVQINELLILLLLVFIQNFVVLVVARLTFPMMFERKAAISMAISLSMKNYAIAAGILLFYDPKASLPPALGFVAHAFLFNAIYLARRSRFFQPNSRN